jgi:twinkle protein
LSTIISPSTFDFDAYFADQHDEAAHVKPASAWVEAVIDRFYGQGAESNWTPAGFDKMGGKFDIRPGEVTIWAGINGHGKTTYLSHVMLNLLQTRQKVCMVSLEMRPADTMAKMSRQSAGSGAPSINHIRAFHRWTDGKLWIYDHLGRLATTRALAVATYARKVLKLDHIVIDSLMKCGIGTEDYTAQKDFVDALCALARDTGLHVHLVCHMRKGENERTAPGKFDVMGAGDITNLVDNLAIVWMNVRKAEKPDEDTTTKEADCFVRIAKQRHHPWTGSFAFWFDKASQQYLEHQHMRPTYVQGVMEPTGGRP